MKRIIVWLDFPSLHQAPVLREIARCGVPVFALAARDVPEWRRHQGWERPDFGDVQLEIAPDEGRQRELIETAPETTTHLFFGIHAYPFVHGALQRVTATRATVGVWAEPQFVVGWKGPLRLLRSRQNARRYGDKIDFIMAAGQLGVNWYRLSGFPEQKLFPFGYFINGPPAGQWSPASAPVAVGNTRSDAVRLLFVGELASHKGLDLLLRALAKQRREGWFLDIVGDGPLMKEYRSMGSRLGLADKIGWRGILPNSDVRLLMAQADFLVLPSRFDGWGAVVNEALMAGTPVVCSDACGAADLLRVAEFGTVFRAGSVQALKKALNGHLDRGRLAPSDRERVLRLRHRIEPAAAARYFLDVILFVRGGAAGERPVAPWRKAGEVG